ncbi:MAG: hypothetical protein Q8J96_16500 [Rhodocyclaceae bacterium]|nr:hypothetical protein [Rhodocyclaceae bacterium]
MARGTSPRRRQGAFAQMNREPQQMLRGMPIETTKVGKNRVLVKLPKKKAGRQ